MERGRPEPKITQQDFTDALESFIQRIEANIQADKNAYAFNSLLELTSFKNKNIVVIKERLQAAIKQALTHTYFNPTLNAILDKMKDATKLHQHPEFSQHLVSRGLLRGFFEQHKQVIEDNNKIYTDKFLDLYRLYCNANWRDTDLHDSFIKGFGQNFDNFNEYELISFCESLAIIGLKQEDIFKSVLEKVQESLKKDETKDASKFRRIHYNLQSAMFNAGLGETELSQNVMKGAEEYYGKPAETLLVEGLNLRQKINLVNFILASGQEEKYGFVSNCFIYLWRVLVQTFGRRSQ